MKNVPWLSLSILFSAYATFSWFITHWFASHVDESLAEWAVWVLVLLFTLLQALLLTTLFDGLKRFSRMWLKSDVGYFTLIIIGSMSITAALVWFKLFGYFLVLISSEILARLDLQNAKLNRWQSLAVLTLVSMTGLAAGWATRLNPILLFL